jgi:hypothetical protein
VYVLTRNVVATHQELESETRRAIDKAALASGGTVEQFDCKRFDGHEFLL